MELLILTTLALYILAYHSFISMLPNRTRIIAITPEFSIVFSSPPDNAGIFLWQ